MMHSDFFIGNLSKNLRIKICRYVKFSAEMEFNKIDPCSPSCRSDRARRSRSYAGRSQPWTSCNDVMATDLQNTLHICMHVCMYVCIQRIIFPI
jgi:hypothetical protein